ncbi:endonuclease domain-containing protein [Rhodohalobacter mucosus]|uniref:DNA methylase n=1 Tax=Rhodohalobacter mucosus TaxID=2079485 RepID=A0A316TL63_9BACT|nr:endonuclease domain-containing protein [Rhodohalobacter mucosus]PWN05297.1 DNA methylase [Rhodohalobacter mucosus]
MKRPIISYNPKLKKLARELRNNSTMSEIILWKHLKGRQMYGYDFHRQRPVDQFIVDFICSELWLVIELYGYSHLLEVQAAADIARERRLQELGLNVIRFWNEEVLKDIDYVLGAIEHEVLLQKRKLGL